VVRIHPLPLVGTVVVAMHTSDVYFSCMLENEVNGCVHDAVLPDCNISSSTTLVPTYVGALGAKVTA
jgi:hypothetical protein